MRWLIFVAACGGAAPAPAVTNHANPPLRHEAEITGADALVPLRVVLVGSPAAVGSCMKQPETCYQTERGGRRLLVDPEIKLVRWRDLAIYATAAEAAHVAEFLDGPGPHDFEKLAFAGMVGDIGMQATKRGDLAVIGRDSGLVLDGPDGFFIECWSCSAPAVVTGLAALGVRWSHAP